MQSFIRDHRLVEIKINVGRISDFIVHVEGFVALNGKGNESVTRGLIAVAVRQCDLVKDDFQQIAWE